MNSGQFIAGKRKRHFRRRICMRCAHSYEPLTLKQRYCGSPRLSGTCAYEERRQREAIRAARYAAAHKSDRFSAYGMTRAQFDQLVAEQNGKCAVCNRLPLRGRSLEIDHDHTSQLVRGLLCGFCNRALGLFKDDPTRLRAAIDYLNRPKLSMQRRAKIRRGAGRSKLNDSAVREILNGAAAGQSQAALALQHGVSQSTISYIVLGITWKHVKRTVMGGM